MIDRDPLLDDILWALAIIGAMFIVCIIVCVVISVCYSIKEKIYNVRYRYKIAHRFDKDPVAKCYCKDCNAYKANTNECTRTKCNEPENGFCWCAYPNTREEAERKEELKY